jgi:hypothetical protein
MAGRHPGAGSVDPCAHLVVGRRLGLFGLAVHETRKSAELEAANHAGPDEDLSTREVAVLTSFREKTLSAASQAGMVNNLNDGLARGPFSRCSSLPTA